MLWATTGFSKILSGAGILFLLILFQSFLSEMVSIMGIRFDLAIIILVYLSLTQGPTYGVIFGFLIGLLLDVFTPQTLGWGALVKCLIGFAVGSFKDKLYLESLYSKGGVIFFALISNDLLYYIFTQGVNGSTFRTWTNYTLPSAFYTALVGMLIFFGLSRVHLKRSNVEKVSA